MLTTAVHYNEVSGMRISTVSLVCMLVASACGRDTPAASDTGCGTSSCESTTWPRLVIALADERPTDRDAGAGSLPVVSITAVFDGKEYQPGLTGGGCPNGVDVITCSDSFYGHPGLQQMELRVSIAPLPAISRLVPLRAFNYCGNNLAYVHVSVAADAKVTIGDIEYVSPCRILP